MKSRLIGVGLLALAAAIACNRDATTPHVLQSSVSAAQPAAMQALAGSIALAMQDQGLRQRVKQDMWHAPFREHKLQLADYFRGESGGILLAKITKESNLNATQVFALIDQVGPLEFYMPVQGQRESWTGVLTFSLEHNCFKTVSQLHLTFMAMRCRSRFRRHLRAPS